MYARNANGLMGRLAPVWDLSERKTPDGLTAERGSHRASNDGDEMPP